MSLLPFNYNVLFNFGQFAELLCCQSLEFSDVFFAHVDKLGILYGNCVDGVGIMLAQWGRVAEAWQFAIYPHIVCRKVEELLGFQRC